MTKEQFEREKVYQMTLHFVRILFRDGLLTEDEKHKIEVMFMKKYSSVLGSLYP